jgi:hypothetical protein
MLACGGLFIASSWDEVNCVAGESTSSGPCGVSIVWGGSLISLGIALVLIGCIAMVRAARRPIDPDGGDGWRIGQAFVVMTCGALLALAIPRYRCPSGTTLSPVFRFCVSHDVSYPAPSPGMPWKFAAVGLGIAIGIVMIRWRSIPIWLATAIVVVASVGTSLYVVSRATGIPGFRSYTPAMVLALPQMWTPSRLRPGATLPRRPALRS